MTTRIVQWTGDEPSLGPAAVAIGVFDGVHIGHQALLRDTVRFARERGVLSVALTFDRDPDQVVTPDHAAPQLLLLEDKLRYMSETGLDVILVVPFCSHVAGMQPDRFLDDMLTAAFDPQLVVVGYDFRFGAHASGDVETLRKHGEQASFDVMAHELLQVGGETVTSTRIRGCIAAGDVAAATELLGRYHRLVGRVTHGRGEGESLLGVPTANIRPVTVYAALPADGVYAGYTLVDGERQPSAISVGVPPSFPKALDCLEAHLLDWSGELYAKQVTIEFVEHIRPHETFTDAARLAARIQQDIGHVRMILDA
ncbi:MAG: riboflavin biosynthesis protein RibF [Actinobacteria bacterium HGW-Actinobacteria-10]|nr:MAG: riboflavin biosynthesis protein RibF [Actinobacteria bacterium HGW-Actinobacteria-10]